MSSKRKPKPKPKPIKRKPETIDPFNVRVGERVRFARLQRGLAQNELGKFLAFLPPSAIWRYEMGTRGFSPKQLGLLSYHLGCSIDWLVTGREYRVRARRPAKRNVLQFDGPIKALEATGRLGALSMEERHVLHEHLKTGESPEIYDLEAFVLQMRYKADGTDAGLRELMQGEGRKTNALGVTKRKSTPAAGKPKRRKADALA